MSESIKVSISAPDLAKLNAELGAYSKLSRKTLAEVVAKKGDDLGIQLEKAYRAVRWGGESGKGIARAELASRAASGIGTKVRPSLRAKFKAEYAGLSERINGSTKKETVARRQRLNLWQKYVKKEVGLRASGRGVLGVSFLPFKNRGAVPQQSFDVKARTGDTMAEVVRGDGYISITGYTAGLGVVNARYGIVNSAAAAVRADMDLYFRRKLGENSAAYRFLKSQ